MDLKSIFNLAVKKPLQNRTTENRLIGKVIKKNETITRRDIGDWKIALQEAGRADNPKQVRLQTLYDNIAYDALLSSQMGLRIDKTQGADFIIADASGKADDAVTELVKDSGLYDSLVEIIIESKFYGHSLIEFSYDTTGRCVPQLIPRRNVSPETGTFYPDLSGNTGIKYRELPEFGKNVIEFNCNRWKDYGILNRAIPHVLMKKFAQGCWSELCEIYGIPPRVMKTDTTSPEMLQRAEDMMKTIGSAAWFIIDTTEQFEFASNMTNTNGDVYNNLIQLCNNEISLLTLGAIIGQDTVNGNRSKEESSQKLTNSVVLADQRFIEAQFNHVVMPALASIGLIRDGLRLSIQKETDIDSLWDMTFQASQFYDINPNWVKEKFGIDITGAKTFGGDPEAKLHGFFGQAPMGGDPLLSDF